MVLEAYSLWEVESDAHHADEIHQLFYVERSLSDFSVHSVLIRAGGWFLSLVCFLLQLKTLMTWNCYSQDFFRYSIEGSTLCFCFFHFKDIMRQLFKTKLISASCLSCTCTCNPSVFTAEGQLLWGQLGSAERAKEEERNLECLCEDELKAYLVSVLIIICLFI